MQDKNNCVGSYSVSGYTRADGTEVSGHTRTCGAAHLSHEQEQAKLIRRANLLYPSMNNIKDSSAKNKEEYEIINNVKYPKNINSKEIEILKENAKKEIKEIEKERFKNHTRTLAGAALELGSAFIPIGGEIKAASNVVKALTPTLGRKVSEEVVKQTIKGSLSGGLFGLGEGLIENKNPIKTSLKDATIGGISGALSGGIIKKIERNMEIEKVEKLLEKRKDWGIAYQKASGNPELAIETLLKKQQGFVPSAINKKGIGEIDFVWGEKGKKGYGLAHIIENRNKQGINGEEFVKRLPQIIKDGKIEYNEKQPNITFIRDKDNKALIKMVWNNENRKWIVTSYKVY